VADPARPGLGMMPALGISWPVSRRSGADVRFSRSRRQRALGGIERCRYDALRSAARAPGRNLPDHSSVRAETTRRMGTSPLYAPQWCEHGCLANTASRPGLRSTRLEHRPNASCVRPSRRDSGPAVDTVGRLGAGASLTRGTRAFGSPHSRTSRREPDPRWLLRHWCRGHVVATQLEPGDAGICRGRRSEVNSSECTCRRSVSRSGEAHE
jgi:hypothetical protein